MWISGARLCPLTEFPLLGRELLREEQNMGSHVRTLNGPLSFKFALNCKNHNQKTLKFMSAGFYQSLFRIKCEQMLDE